MKRRVPMSLEQPPTEVWKPIPGYEPKYEVSDAGNVRSRDHWDGRRNVTGRQLRPGTQSKCGHVTVSLGRHNSKTVHSLVLLAFVGARPDGHDVLHMNHVASDNRLVNLRYGTRSENLKMDYIIGTRHTPTAWIDSANGQRHRGATV